MGANALRTKRTVPAENFCATLAVNIDNDRLSPDEFREFVVNTLDIVVFPRREEIEAGGRMPQAGAESYLSMISEAALDEGVSSAMFRHLCRLGVHVAVPPQNDLDRGHNPRR
jgi:hypothetical protein